jgi:hypothetical protein
VRQRIDERGRDREVWVEEVTEADPLCLRDESEFIGVRVEGPTALAVGDLKARFIVTVEDTVRETSSGVLECDFNRGGAEPSNIDNCGDPLGSQTTDNAVAADILKVRDGVTSPWSPALPRLVRTDHVRTDRVWSGAARARSAALGSQRPADVWAPALPSVQLLDLRRPLQDAA